ncbi:bleomycin resistance protein [Parapedobacter lycopersici]|uniref:bleomycin resistance protein n=1 Tax=Parapedobacter lycopersici TaxID=1864939 RepID=UPI00214DA41C|nr:VOC family protein [Parapedobacter lycopersici]
MLTSVHPKLPMRNKVATREYYVDKLGFRPVGDAEYDDYLLVEKDHVELHFFLFRELDPKENYGQVYIRTDDIDALYQWMLDQGVPIHPNGSLQTRPWGQREFHLLDPDHNLLTFGQAV